MFQKKYNGHRIGDLEEGVEISIKDYEELLRTNGFNPWYRANGQYVWAKNSNMRKDRFYEIQGEPISFDENYPAQKRIIKEIKDPSSIEKIKKMSPNLEHSDISMEPTPIPRHSDLYGAVRDHIAP